MKKLALLIVCAVAPFLSVLVAQTPAKLIIQVENVMSNKGKIYIGVYDTEESYLNKRNHIKGLVLSPSVPSVQGSVEIPAGKYAISVYQDINGNGKLDTNMLGIPKEPYGLSNGILRPDFQKALIQIDASKNVVISL